MSSPSEMSFSGTDDEPGFAGGLSNPETTQYKLRRQVIDIVNHLMSYGFALLLAPTVLSIAHSFLHIPFVPS
ncbi:hypothetical protein FS842_006309 [Serendipita sp. 407]|nr:hypothetical protein FS842_006309 [Serendipita sp. 407]